jgi:hypothetical protein
MFPPSERCDDLLLLWGEVVLALGIVLQIPPIVVLSQD